MVAAAASETRTSHRVARVSAALMLAPLSLSCQVRDSTPPAQTEAPLRSEWIAVVQQWRGVR